MKKIMIVIFIVIILSTSFFIFGRDTKLQLESKNFSDITITSLPSPPTTNKFENYESISKIVNKLNDINLKKALMSNEKGWIHLIKINGEKNYSIQISSKYIIVNERTYMVDDIDELIEFFDNLVN